jgi:hypothetical protein
MSYRRYLRIAAPAATAITGVASAPGTGVRHTARPSTITAADTVTAYMNQRSCRASSPRARRSRTTTQAAQVSWNSR